MMFIPQPEEPVTEEPQAPDPVLVWRRDYLVRAGYDLEAAELLAEDRGVDLHRAEHLLVVGCPVNTALLILL